MGLKTLFPIIAILNLWASPWSNNTEASLNVSLTEFGNHSNLTLENQSIKQDLNKYLILSQKLRVFINKTFEATMGVGIRKSLYDNVAGVHIFMDLSKNLYTFFPQFGTTFEILGKRVDWRFNSYFPFPSSKLENDYFWKSKSTNDTDFLWRSHIWSELETVVKFQKFSFSVVPGYNFSTQLPVAKVKATVPTSFCSFSGGFQYDTQRGISPFMFISIPFYSCKNIKKAPTVSHNGGVNCEGSQGKFKFSKPSSNKKTYKVIRKEKEEIEELIKNFPKKENIPNQKATPATPSEKGWWDILFGVIN